MPTLNIPKQRYHSDAWMYDDDHIRRLHSEKFRRIGIPRMSSKTYLLLRNRNEDHDLHRSTIRTFIYDQLVEKPKMKKRNRISEIIIPESMNDHHCASCAEITLETKVQ